MHSVKTCLAAAALACVARANTVKVTATSGNTFTPDTVRAEAGDTIEFHFQATNHSVVSGVFENPCSPMQLGSGFYSGFMSASSGEAGKVFRVKVNSVDPVPFYSSQSDECQKGMVGVINPQGQKTVDAYRNQAKSLSRSVTPGSAPYGGELKDNDDPNVQRNPDGTVKAAAGALSVPMMGLVAAMGLIPLMV